MKWNERIYQLNLPAYKKKKLHVFLSPSFRDFLWLFTVRNSREIHSSGSVFVSSFILVEIRCNLGTPNEILHWLENITGWETALALWQGLVEVISSYWNGIKPTSTNPLLLFKKKYKKKKKERETCWISIQTK